MFVERVKDYFFRVVCDHPSPLPHRPNNHPTASSTFIYTAHLEKIHKHPRNLRNECKKYERTKVRSCAVYIYICRCVQSGIIIIAGGGLGELNGGVGMLLLLLLSTL